MYFRCRFIIAARKGQPKSLGGQAAPQLCPILTGSTLSRVEKVDRNLLVEEIGDVSLNTSPPGKTGR
jgi:hypothetical protein